MPSIFAPINSVRNSAVCTVRISGNNALAVQMYIPALEKVQPKVAMLVKIYNENQMLDEAIALYFKGPNSFTGEDIIEISMHSSAFIVSTFLLLLAKIEGFRFAKPGEFCLQAVQNEKISLTKAEAINKLIGSESAVQHRFAIAEFNGVCQNYYASIKFNIVKAISLLETYIDFSEDEAISLNLTVELKNLISKVILAIQKTLSYAAAKEDFDVSIAIVGKPNAGKSSLFNYLTHTQDAIVSHIAGTTRDAIRKNIIIAGFKVQLVDTAGIRNSTDEIEKIGIERALSVASSANIVLHLQHGDAENNIPIPKGEALVIPVWAKSDIQPPPQNIVAISVKNGDIMQLENAIGKVLEEKLEGMQSAGFICNERQKVILQNTVEILNSINYNFEAEIISENLRSALSTVSQLVGIVDTEEILGEIFSSFCIGK